MHVTLIITIIDHQGEKANESSTNKMEFISH